MTHAQWTVLPLLLHVLLTFAVGGLTLRRRIDTLRAGKAKLSDIALDNSRWPDEARKFSNNYDNQFQAPMLAYGAVALLIATGLADMASAILMWLFLGARVMHSVEHTGANNVRRRLMWFLASFTAVVALWAWFALRYFVTG